MAVNKWLVVTRHTSSVLIGLVCIIILSSCGVIRSQTISKIVLLAPFEGRYREIGYNALYAVRLAIADSSADDIHLLAVDDGGNVQSAELRIRALNTDPDVKMIILLGQFASHPDVQQANDKPLIIIGYWGHPPVDDETLILTNQELAARVNPIDDITTLDTTRDYIVGDLFMLAQVPDLYDELSQLEVVSSGALADDDFTERYVNSDLYVPEPNLLATLTYDVCRMMILALQTETQLADMTYSGINGDISFENGYWQNAPVNRYRYADNALVAITD